MSRRANAVMALVVGFAIGVALPFIQVYLACGSPASEACVWGKALLPLTVSISAVLFGAIIALAIFGVLESRRPTPPEGEAAEE